MSATTLNEIVKWSRIIYGKGYVQGPGGNISVREGDQIYITKHGVSFQDLTPEDIVQVPLKKKSEFDGSASVELPTHREIYKVTGSKAIIHVHPIYTIALSLKTKEIKPLDVEGLFHLGEVPVVEGSPGTYLQAKAISKGLGDNKIIVVRRHGVFSAGETLKEAFEKIEVLEASAKIIYLCKNMDKGNF